MAIAVGHLTTSGDAVDNSDFTTDSISPSTSALVLAIVQSGLSPFEVPGDPVLTGCGLTWVQVGSRIADGSDVHHFNVYRAMGTATPGAVNIDFVGEVQAYCQWSILQFTGVDTSGTNGSGAVVQTTTNTGSGVTSLTVTLAAFGSVNNATFGGFGSPNGRTYTAGTSFTIAGQHQNTGAGSVATESQLANDTSVDITASSSATLLGRAIEIKAAAAGVDATATPSAIAVPATVPAVTKLATSVIVPSPISATTSIPAVTKLAVSTTTPSAIAVPITVPQVIASGAGQGTATPSAIAVPVTVPAPTLKADATVTPNVINVSVSLPPNTNLATANIVPDPFSVTITLPAPTLEGNIPGVATPDAISVSIAVPTLTSEEIPNFTPPGTDTYAPYNSETKGPALRLARHRRPGIRGVNVYYIDGVATETDPFTTYDSNGVVLEASWDRVDKVWWGGHEPEQVTDAQAAALTTAGYSLGQDALVGA